MSRFLKALSMMAIGVAAAFWGGCSAAAGSDESIAAQKQFNGTDIKKLREKIALGEITALDLSDVAIVSGGEAYYEKDGTEYTTTDNVIGDYMFSGCKNLEQLVLPASITSVGGYAFTNSGLTQIDIPNPVTALGRDAFSQCSSLETVILGTGVKSLAQGVFWSSAVKHVYVKAATPPAVSAYLFTSNPVIHVYTEALSAYQASAWAQFGTIVGGLEELYPDDMAPVFALRPLMKTYFEDDACTSLTAVYAAMSDDALTAALASDGVPAGIIAAAITVKNESWAEYEKEFRIHAYSAYSDANYWNGKLKATGGSYMGNPTGVYTADESELYVFVSQDVPEDATLYLAACSGNTLIKSAKTGTPLSKGLNIIAGEKDALYYIVYTADTSARTKTLAEWPAITVHIEGGIVNGYYDISRHSDDDYAKILQRATHELFTVKGAAAVFNFKTETYKSAWPDSIASSIGWFDSLTVWEKELMGISSAVANGERASSPYYLTGGESFFPDYYNNPNFAIEGSSSDSGYANSTTYRTSYNSAGCVAQSFNVTRSDHDDWCTAHECGHNNQGAINLEACTEVSNNLFSNVVRFLTGRSVSRGLTVSTMMQEYAAGTPFFTRNIWSMTRMYYQLYLYYHQAGHNTSFYPELFKALRDDPLALWNDTNKSSLKFVRTVCKVAQEDLTDFFTAWGFFVPCTLEINDYGNRTLTVTQEDIDSTLSEIAQYPKKNRAILFIEDRVEPLLTTGYLTEAGQNRKDGNSDKNYGDLGQFTAYRAGAQEPADYTYTQNGSVISLSGRGGVGFLVQASDGTLIYASNALEFTLPERAGESYKIYAVDADSSLHDVESML